MSRIEQIQNNILTIPRDKLYSPAYAMAHKQGSVYEGHCLQRKNGNCLFGKCSNCNYLSYTFDKFLELNIQSAKRYNLELLEDFGLQLDPKYGVLKIYSLHDIGKKPTLLTLTISQHESDSQTGLQKGDYIVSSSINPKNKWRDYFIKRRILEKPIKVFDNP